MKPKYGFLDQLRSQHWAVKVIFVIVASVVLSPFAALAMFILGAMFGEFAVALFTLGLIAAAGWFVFTSPPDVSAAPTETLANEWESSHVPVTDDQVRQTRYSDAPRYCENCGASFAKSVMHCPACATEWNWPVFTNPTGEIARYLNLLVRDYQDGLIDARNFIRLRGEYEGRLALLRVHLETAAAEPEPPAVVPEAVVPIAAEPEPPAVVPEPVVPIAIEPPPLVAVPLELPPLVAIEPLPEAEPTEVPVAAITPDATAELAEVPVAAITPDAVAEGTKPAERPVAAIPPSPPGPTVGDMGRAVLGWAAERQADILLYVGAFMLSVAAIIFMAYQGEALSGGIRFVILTVYAVAFLSMGLLLHRWERVREAGPVFLALGAVLIPIDFLALRTQVLGQDQVSNEVLWLLGSGTCSALYFSLALRGYGRFYYVPAAPSALVAWGSLGAVLQLPDAWFGPWYLLLAVPAYVGGIAYLERQSLARWAIIASIIVAIPSVAATQLVTGFTGDDRFALTAAYAMVTAAAGTGLRWRRDMLVIALLPPLAGLVGGSFAWAAFDVAPEWFIPFIAAAALGYLVVAHFEPEARAREWALVAVAGVAAALVFASSLTATDAQRGVLPVTYALAFIGASGAYGRWRWTAAAGLMPPLAALLVVTTAWASNGVGVEWYGICAGVAPLGYLALAFFDTPDRRPSWRWAAAICALLGPAISHVSIATDASAEHWALAAAWAPPLVAAAIASVQWRFTWRLGPGAIPAFAAMTALSAAWAQWDLEFEWFPAFAAAASLGYVALAWLDKPNFDRMWAGLAGLAAVGAIAGAHVAVLDTEANRWSLPVAYALVLSGASASFVKWRFDWSPPAGFLPPLAAMTALSFSWAQWDIAPEWYPSFGAAAALGYVALAWFENPLRQRMWAEFAVAFGAISVGGAHLGVLADDANRWALFSTYVPCLAGAGVAFAHWRFAWRIAPGLVPPLAGMTALSFSWAQWDVAPEWFASFCAAAALGYIALAWLERRGLPLLWGQFALVFGAVALAGAHTGVLEPEANRWALFTTYIQLLAGASTVFALWRFQWRLAPGLVPPLAAMTALTFSWAQWDLAPEWYSGFGAAAALGYVALAWLDRRGLAAMWAQLALVFGAVSVGVAHTSVLDVSVSRWALFPAYVQALAGAGAVFALWRFQWRLAPGLVPPLAAMTALAVAWAQWDLAVEWYPSFALAAGLGYLVLARLDVASYARTWGAIAGAVAVGALVGAHLAVPVEGAETSALPVAYALALAGIAAAFWQWRWFEAGSVLPPAVAMTALTAGWAWFELEPEWYGCFAAATAFGYLALARFDFPARREYWWSGAVLGPVVGLGLAHPTVALDSEASKFALPAVYAICLAASTAAFATWRFVWRVAPATIPALASALALSYSWAQWDVSLWWWGAFIVPAAYGYIALALADEKPVFRYWLYGAAFASVLGVGMAQAMQIDVEAAHRALPLVYGEALFATTFVVAWWRFATREAVAVLSPLAAAFGASLGWAEFDMRFEWMTAWIAAAGAGYFVPAYFEARFRNSWRAASLVFSAVALLGAHSLALEPEPLRWQLPVSYGVLLLVWVWHAVALRDETSVGPPLLGSIFGAALLWAAGVPAEWWAYPALAIAAAMMLGEPVLRKSRFMDRVAWAYAVSLAVVATVVILPVNYSHPEHGLATQLVTAALLFLAAARSANTIVKFIWPEPTPILLRSERQVLIQAGFAFVFGAAASLNGLLGIESTDRAWALAAVGAVPWIILALPVLRRDALWTFAPLGLMGATIAVFLAVGSDGTLTGVLAAAALGPVIACFGIRRWAFLGIANSFLFLAVWAGWRWLEADIAYLPLGFAALAVVEWAVLMRLRKYTPAPGESDLVIAYLSWGPWLISGLVAGILLSRKQSELEAGTSLVTTSEWALAAAVLAMASAAVTGEGLRLWKRWVWIGGSVGLITALLMGIATFEPSNVQAYTVPIGAYLIVIGLTFRASPELISRHLLIHEALMLVGALFLVLPPAEQSFAPGGGKFGLELIGVSLAMLIVGLLLHGRWLVAAGVTTMTITAMRMVTGGLFSTPYWLLLGIGGTALLAFGFLVLLERERWDRFRHRVVRWWQETAAKGPPSDGPEATPVT